MIIKNKKGSRAEFDALKFVLAAIGENDKIWVQGGHDKIWVQDGQVFAHSGPKLHLIDSALNLADGVYKAVRSTKTLIEMVFHDAKYPQPPDISGVLKGYSDRDNFPVELGEDMSPQVFKSTVIESLYRTVKWTGELIDPDLFLGAVGHMPNGYQVYVDRQKPKGPVVIAGFGSMFIAAFMPLNSAWEKL